MSQLFEPWQLGDLSLDNRILIAPMCQYSAVEGSASDWHLIHLGHLALSGAGLLITEATAVSPEGRISFHDLGLYSDENEAALARVLRAIRTYSAMPVAVQLAHAGRKASCARPWTGGGQIPPQDPEGWQTVAPSAVPFKDSEHAPLMLDETGLEKVRRDFVAAAMRADRLGFDGIELHGAHGYLLHEFLSPLSNRRSDQYGGSLENRMRFPLEVFEAVRDACPQRPIWVRVSASDWAEGGLTVDETCIFAAQLKARGCAAIHVSSGGLAVNQSIPAGPGYQVGFAEKIRREAEIPVIAVGLITEPQQAEEIIATEQADAVALGRAILYDPRWPWHAAAALGAAVKAPPQYLRSAPRGAEQVFAART